MQLVQTESEENCVVDPAQRKIACRFSGRSVGTRPLGIYISVEGV